MRMKHDESAEFPGCSGGCGHRNPLGGTQTVSIVPDSINPIYEVNE